MNLYIYSIIYRAQIYNIFLVPKKFKHYICLIKNNQIYNLTIANKYMKTKTIKINPADNVAVAILPLAQGENVAIDGQDITINEDIPAGQVFVDGSGVGDVGNVVLRDRKRLAEDGLIIVVATMDSYTGEILAGPDIMTRGFVYVRESEELIDEAKQLMKQVMDNCRERNIREWGNIKSAMRDALSDYIYQKTKRSPMILPIIMEV